MEVKVCPKCASANIDVLTALFDTGILGFRIRLHCKDCGFQPPQSKWQPYSEKKATEIWNMYKRRKK